MFRSDEGLVLEKPTLLSPCDDNSTLVNPFDTKVS